MNSNQLQLAPHVVVVVIVLRPVINISADIIVDVVAPTIDVDVLVDIDVEVSVGVITALEFGSWTVFNRRPPALLRCGESRPLVQSWMALLSAAPEENTGAQTFGAIDPDEPVSIIFANLLAVDRIQAGPQRSCVNERALKNI